MTQETAHLPSKHEKRKKLLGVPGMSSMYSQPLPITSGTTTLWLFFRPEFLKMFSVRTLLGFFTFPVQASYTWRHWESWSLGWPLSLKISIFELLDFHVWVSNTTVFSIYLLFFRFHELSKFFLDLSQQLKKSTLPQFNYNSWKINRTLNCLANTHTQSKFYSHGWLLLNSPPQAPNWVPEIMHFYLPVAIFIQEASWREGKGDR
jgi:hypothetical protein